MSCTIIPCYPAIYRSLLQTEQSLTLLPLRLNEDDFTMILWQLDNPSASLSCAMNQTETECLTLWCLQTDVASSMRKLKLNEGAQNSLADAQSYEIFITERRISSGTHILFWPWGKFCPIFLNRHTIKHFWSWHSPKYSISFPSCYKLPRAISVK